MKRIIGVVLAALLASVVLGGCGSESNALKDMKVEKYVTLGEYKGLPAEVAAVTVDETQEAELMKALYMDSVTKELGGITDRAVSLGDTVNIDYEGKKDGVAFQRGTASGDILEIGSGSFIEGFEEGLIGAMPGETRDLELTFPEGYQNPELAGQAVVFTVTVNFILPTEYSDEVVAAIGVPDITTVEEMRQFVHNYLETNARNNYQVTLENALMDGLVSGCVFREIPAAVLEKYYNNVRAGLEADSASQGMDLETYCMYNYRMGSEDFLNQYAEVAAKQSLAVQAVANAENLNISDEELQENLEQYATLGGYDTVEDFLGDLDKEEYREFFLLEKVLDFLTENARITEY